MNRKKAFTVFLSIILVISMVSACGATPAPTATSTPMVGAAETATPVASAVETATPVAATAESAAPEVAEPVEIVYWVGGVEPVTDEDKAKDIDWQIVNSYNAANTDHVKMVYVAADNDEFNKKMMLAASSKTLPDVFLYTYAAVRGMPESGALTDITSKVESDTEWTSRFKKGAFDSIREVGNGKLYGVPSTVEAQGFYYNKTLLAKYGLEVTENMTWEQFTTIIAKLNENGILPIAAGGKDIWSVWGYYGFFPRYGFLDELDPLLKGTLTFSESKSFRHTFERLEELGKLGAYPKNFTTTGYAQAVEMFKEGTAGFLSTGTWTIGEMEISKVQKDIGWTWGPTFPDGIGEQKYGLKSFVWGRYAGLPAGESEQKLNAVCKFIKNFSSSDSVKLMVSKGGLPAAIVDSSLIKADEPVALMMQKMLNDDYLPVGQTTDYFDSSFFTPLWNSMNSVMSGISTVDEALAALDDWYKSSN